MKTKSKNIKKTITCLLLTQTGLAPLAVHAQEEQKPKNSLSLPINTREVIQLSDGRFDIDVVSCNFAVNKTVLVPIVDGKLITSGANLDIKNKDLPFIEITKVRNDELEESAKIKARLIVEALMTSELKGEHESQQIILDAVQHKADELSGELMESSILDLSALRLKKMQEVRESDAKLTNDLTSLVRLLNDLGMQQSLKLRALGATRTVLKSLPFINRIDRVGEFINSIDERFTTIQEQIQSLIEGLNEGAVRLSNDSVALKTRALSNSSKMGKYEEVMVENAYVMIFLGKALQQLKEKNYVIQARQLEEHILPQVESSIGDFGQLVFAFNSAQRATETQIKTNDLLKTQILRTLQLNVGIIITGYENKVAAERAKTVGVVIDATRRTTEATLLDMAKANRDSQRQVYKLMGSSFIDVKVQKELKKIQDQTDKEGAQLQKKLIKDVRVNNSAILSLGNKPKNGLNTLSLPPKVQQIVTQQISLGTTGDASN